MWIRSQDLYTLIKCERLSIRKCDSENYCVIGDECVVLGEYSTEEKALNVLREIQNAISDRVIVNGKLYSSPRRSNESRATTSERVVIYVMPVYEDVS